MKHLQQYKTFLSGLLVGLLLVSGGTYASVTGAGTIGSLFEDIGGNTYRLVGNFIKDGTVGADELGPNSVGNSELANNAVRSTNILDNSINSIDIQNETVTSNDLGSNSVGNDELRNSESFTMRNLSLNSRHIFMGNQDLYGDNSTALYFDSNSSTNSQLIIRDRENTIYGRLYGSSDGQNFGLLDGDSNWSYLASKDNYTAFRINDSEKLRILSNGNVGIGINSPSERLDIVGNIKVSGNVTAQDFLYSSDKRLKKDVKIIDSALGKVMELEGVNFSWKDDGEKAIGFIAQDVEKVLPELVTTNSEGMKSVKYGNITAILVEAIKEQSEELKKLKEEISILRK